MAARRKTAGTSNRIHKKAGKMTKGKKNPLMREVISISLVAAGILLILSIFTKNGAGYLGTLIYTGLTGFFGFGAFLLPFVIIGLGIFTFLNKTPIHISKIIICFIILLCIISFTHVLNFDDTVKYSDFMDYLIGCYQSGNVSNGGLVGAIFGNGFLKAFGKIGTYIFLAAVTLILVILITGKSFFKAVSLAFEKMTSIAQGAYDYEDEDYDYEEEEVEKKPKSKTEKQSDQEKEEVKKSPMFTIEERSKKKHYDKENNKILLVNEEVTDGNRKITILKELKNKNITNEITLDPVDEIQHPVVSKQEIRMNGIGEESQEPEEANKNLHTENVVTEPIAQPIEDRLEMEKRIDFEEPREEIFIKTAGVFDEDRIQTPIVQDEKILDDRAFLAKEVLETKINMTRTAPVPQSPEMERHIVFNSSENREYLFPAIDFLNKNPATISSGSKAQILENSRKLEETLKSFGVEAKVIEVSKGPTVTRYELSPGPGVKVSKISNLADDLALNLAAVGIRIEAPIPGKAAVGIEIPNKEVTPVFLREVLDDEKFKKFPSKLAFGLGKDIAGNTVVADIAKMPHMLIAGATGSGKSVCINTLITSIIYKASPDDVKLLMIDPKVVELSIYNGIPHLLIPVVTDPKKAAGALNWAVQEMITRYGLFAETSVRDLKGYNATLTERGEGNLLPQIVIIIDELADLMMAAPGEVEDAICRLAQMARAAGLHLIIATQRPSVDVITGLIKANIPSRLAFSVSSGIDSRTVLDMVGAEKLLGKGDMLFYPVGMSKPLRVQGAFVSDKEVENIVNFVKQGKAHEYDQEMIDKITASKNIGNVNEDVDEFFEQAVAFIIEKDKASASLLQRQFRIGYNRASRLIEDLEARGIVGPEDGSKPRKVLMTSYQWEEFKQQNNS